jgi:hypothetical protein
MSILGSIVSAIFRHAGVTTSAQAAPGAPAAPASGGAAGGAMSGTMPPKQPANSVDVDAALTKLAAQSKEKLDWRQSIVDLMKLLNLDSSLAARKELAQELHYTGDTNNSAAMNVWLHAQVMQKLAENGGKVPTDLMHK